MKENARITTKPTLLLQIQRKPRRRKYRSQFGLPSTGFRRGVAFGPIAGSDRRFDGNESVERKKWRESELEMEENKANWARERKRREEKRRERRRLVLLVLVVAAV